MQVAKSCTFAIVLYLAHFTCANFYSLTNYSATPQCAMCKVQDFAQLYSLKVQDFAHLLMHKVQDVAHSLHFCTLKNATFQNVTCSHYMSSYPNLTNNIKYPRIFYSMLRVPHLKIISYGILGLSKFNRILNILICLHAVLFLLQ